LCKAPLVKQRGNELLSFNKSIEGESLMKLPDYERITEDAKRRPELYVGSLSTAHLDIIRGTLNLVCLSTAFMSVSQIYVKLDHSKFLIIVESEGLNDTLASVPDWNNNERLETKLFRISRSDVGEHFLYTINSLRDLAFLDEHIVLSWLTCWLPLSERSALGLRANGVFYFQSYQNGYPVSGIQPNSHIINHHRSNNCGLYLGGDLSKQFFLGLPFAINKVKNDIEYLFKKTNCLIELSEAHLSIDAFM
jgi:hypothetical protein